MSAAAPRSKAIATWLALVFGTLGAHRFYLHGRRDVIGWLSPIPTLIGLAGVVRMDNLGQDDTTSWALIPILGLMIAQAMLSAIVIGLTPDERWNARYRNGQPDAGSGWIPVFGVIVALLLGGTALMGTIAFGGQKYFEYQRLQAETEAAKP
jgi:TM2 domain-containing membrane protein YozV